METKDIVILILVFGTFGAICAAALIRSYLKKRREKQQAAAYREKYVRSVTLMDARFGNLVGEYDTPKKTLLAENLSLPPFGKNSPALITAEDYTPEQDRTVLRCLGIAYDRAEQILAALGESVFAKADDDTLTVAEIAAQIIVTEFQFVFDSEEPFMQVIGGVELDDVTYGLNALYRINEDAWEYEAEGNWA